MTTHQGSCHCGRVAFEVEVDGNNKTATACNCSICQRKGSLLWFVPRDAFKLTTPESNASEYEFNKHRIAHRFCPVCGIHPYAFGVDQKGNQMAAVNIRCLTDIDLDAVPVKHFDGRAL